MDSEVKLRLDKLRFSLNDSRGEVENRFVDCVFLRAVFIDLDLRVSELESAVIRISNLHCGELQIECQLSQSRDQRTNSS